MIRMEFTQYRNCNVQNEIYNLEICSIFVEDHSILRMVLYISDFMLILAAVD